MLLHTTQIPACEFSPNALPFHKLPLILLKAFTRNILYIEEKCMLLEGEEGQEEDLKHIQDFWHSSMSIADSVSPPKCRRNIFSCPHRIFLQFSSHIHPNKSFLRTVDLHETIKGTGNAAMLEAARTTQRQRVSKQALLNTGCLSPAARQSTSTLNPTSNTQLHSTRLLVVTPPACDQRLSFTEESTSECEADRFCRWEYYLY